MPNLRVILFFCLLPGRLFSQSNLIYNDDDGIDPSLLESCRGYGDSLSHARSKNPVFYTFFAGFGENRAYETRLLPDSAFKNREFKPKVVNSSFNSIGWMSHSLYVKSFQFSVKGQYSFLNSAKFTNTASLKGSFQVGWYPSPQKQDETDIYRWQISWLPEKTGSGSIRNSYELNYEIKHFRLGKKSGKPRGVAFWKIYCGYNDYQSSLYYGFGFYTSLFYFPGSPIRGFDLTAGIALNDKQQVKVYTWNAGVMLELLPSSLSTNLLAFADLTNNPVNTHTMLNAGAFIDAAVFSHLFNKPSPQM